MATPPPDWIQIIEPVKLLGLKHQQMMLFNLDRRTDRLTDRILHGTLLEGTCWVQSSVTSNTGSTALLPPLSAWCVPTRSSARSHLAFCTPAKLSGCSLGLVSTSAYQGPGQLIRSGCDWLTGVEGCAVSGKNPATPPHGKTATTQNPKSDLLWAVTVGTVKVPSQTPWVPPGCYSDRARTDPVTQGSSRCLSLKLQTFQVDQFSRVWR